MCVCMCIHAYIRLFVLVHNVSTLCYSSSSVSLYLCIYIYVCIYIYTYVCICIHTYRHTIVYFSSQTSSPGFKSSFSDLFMSYTYINCLFSTGSLKFSTSCQKWSFTYNPHCTKLSFQRANTLNDH